MALSVPYPLEDLSAKLRAGPIALTLRRFDETSGTARGQVWSSQLAPPLWTATVPLVTRLAPEARAVDAKIHALSGMAKSFLWADPSYHPASGGVPGGAVTVAGVSADRTAIALQGLPPGYPVAVGDRLSVAHGADRIWFASFVEEGAADASGTLAPLAVYPYVPFGVGPGAAVEMAVPHLKMMVESYTPFTVAPGRLARSASLTLLQKV
ncbi:hypothetical protein SAMN05877809_1074 [Rhodobacter sp. JA431]|uniref:hypothetical protein n=1 Tax=Rhodobacter sp. JA431 TaxID=570013 RepID=UPI000BC950BD|nr:hypothetical protein [Rhodobacter sp. JA431]SOC13722.1 hypothetical protein SAMN05877809_1074 [Rhodobacter sp. JA431]